MLPICRHQQSVSKLDQHERQLSTDIGYFFYEAYFYWTGPMPRLSQPLRKLSFDIFFRIVTSANEKKGGNLITQVTLRLIDTANITLLRTISMTQDDANRNNIPWH